MNLEDLSVHASSLLQKEGQDYTMDSHNVKGRERSQGFAYDRRDGYCSHHSSSHDPRRTLEGLPNDPQIGRSLYTDCVMQYDTYTSRPARGLQCVFLDTSDTQSQEDAFKFGQDGRPAWLLEGTVLCLMNLCIVASNDVVLCFKNVIIFVSYTAFLFLNTKINITHSSFILSFILLFPSCPSLRVCKVYQNISLLPFSLIFISLLLVFAYLLAQSHSYLIHQRPLPIPYAVSDVLPSSLTLHVFIS